MRVKRRCGIGYGARIWIKEKELVRIWKEKEKTKRAKEERNIEESRIRERNKNGEDEKQ